ncbi:MAG: hypothetical protein KC431_10105 [Myxococcales bacterium]|nr:hypothetical protein [Myxococcales bacterium]
MSEETPLGAKQMQLYAKAIPDLRAGTHTVSIRQTVHDDHDQQRKLLQMDDSYRVNVVGPKYRLTPGDVLGVFPAAGAQEASDLRMPHIALRRRTLPWERTAIRSQPHLPWMALLLLEVPGEGKPDGNGGLTLEAGAKLIRNYSFPEGKGDALQINGLQLAKLAPRTEEMKLLTHVRRVSLADTEGEFAGDDDGYVAIVIGNRLPLPGRNWMAALVSFEQPNAGSDTPIDAWPNSTLNLPVLYYWTYHTEALGGDFQAWAQALHYNGGIHLLGQVPDTKLAAQEPRLNGIGGVELDHRERDGSPERGLYHGPLMAVSTTRSQEIILSTDRARQIAGGLYDVSYAAAFELGRLLAMADRGILQALIAYRRHQWMKRNDERFVPKIKPLANIALIPPVDLMGKLRGEWVMDEILNRNDLVTDPLANMLNGPLNQDITGLTDQLGKLAGLSKGRLESLGLGALAGALPGLEGANLPGGNLGHGGLDLGFELGEFENLGLAGAAGIFEAGFDQLELSHEQLALANMDAIFDLKG